MTPSWKQALAESCVDASEAFRIVGWPAPSPEILAEIVQKYPIRIPRYYLSLVNPSDPNDPIARQCLPDPQELFVDPSDIPDPIGDESRRPVPGIVRKHDNRAVLLLTSFCAMSCRFCFRKTQLAGGHARRSGQNPEHFGLEPAFQLAGGHARRSGQNPERFGLEPAFAYLQSQASIREVILSGGDPLTLADSVLTRVLARLRAIPHINVVRIHSRVPATLPSRITQRLAGKLAAFRPLVLVVHFNHPRELGPAACQALRTLQNAGIPLLNQTVLLKGVNDSVDTLAELSWRLLGAGVTPYYLHHCDRTPGTSGFRTSIACGRALMAGLRERVPGYGLPRYVLDTPGGAGKVDLLTSGVRPRGGQGWEIDLPGGGPCFYPP